MCGPRMGFEAGWKVVMRLRMLSTPGLAQWNFEVRPKPDPPYRPKHGRIGRQANSFAVPHAKAKPWLHAYGR